MATTRRRQVVTVRRWVPEAMESFKPTTAKSWSTYARILVDGLPETPDPDDPQKMRKPIAGLGDRRMDAVTQQDLKKLAQAVRDRAVIRSVNRHGMSAYEGFVSCASAVWREAASQGMRVDNPAEGIKLPPRRRAVPRRALTSEEIQVIWGTLASKSADPELACLVFRLALETGFRRGELLGLRVSGPDLMTETVATGTQAKMDSHRTQPVTAQLAAALEQLSETRHGAKARPSAQLLVNRRGDPITRRWFENTAALVRRHNPELGNPRTVWFTWHLCRHTGATLVERQSGFLMAKLFLGHLMPDVPGRDPTEQYATPSPDDLRRVINRIWTYGPWDV